MTELVLNIAVVAVVVGLGARPTYVLLRDVTWPWQARKVRSFGARVDAALAARAKALELEAAPPVTTVHVDSERTDVRAGGPRLRLVPVEEA